MRVLRVALAGLLLAAFSTAAQAAHVFWVDANDGEAFENPVGAGQTPAGWTQVGAVNVVTDTQPPGQVLEGNQSALIAGVSGRQAITRLETFHDSGEYHWMFYDDMATAKAARVGLTRPADQVAGGPINLASNPRFGAIAVEGGQPVPNYYWHHGFSFGATTVPRSLGWHHMNLKWDVVVDTAGPITRVEYYVDDVLGATRFHTAVLTPTAEWIGAPFGSTSPAWVDTIPEPSTLALLALGLVGFAAGGRRRSV